MTWRLLFPSAGGVGPWSGTRIAVEFIIDLLVEGCSEADILRNYPYLVREDILACLAYARDVLRLEHAFPTAA